MNEPVVRYTSAPEDQPFKACDLLKVLQPCIADLSGLQVIRPSWSEGELPILEIPSHLQKNDTDEEIPLLPGFETLLNSVPVSQRSGWVFEPASLQPKLGRRVRHERPAAEWVSRVVSRIGREAGIIVAEADEHTGRPVKFASAHDLRRSCGERLRNAGVPPLVICRVMRHSS